MEDTSVLKKLFSHLKNQKSQGENFFMNEFILKWKVGFGHKKSCLETFDFEAWEKILRTWE